MALPAHVVVPVVLIGAALLLGGGAAPPSSPVVRRRLNMVMGREPHLYHLPIDIDPAAVVYLGNDVNDIPCLTKVGFPVVVADAHSAVLPHARLVLKRRGGYGAVRELCDLIVERLSPGRTDAQVTVL